MAMTWGFVWLTVTKRYTANLLTACYSCVEISSSNFTLLLSEQWHQSFYLQDIYSKSKQVMLVFLQPVNVGALHCNKQFEGCQCQSQPLTWSYPYEARQVILAVKWWIGQNGVGRHYSD